MWAFIWKVLILPIIKRISLWTFSEKRFLPVWEMTSYKVNLPPIQRNQVITQKNLLHFIFFIHFFFVFLVYFPFWNKVYLPVSTIGSSFKQILSAGFLVSLQDEELYSLHLRENKFQLSQQRNGHCPWNFGFLRD